MNAKASFVTTRQGRVACMEGGAEGLPVLLIHGNSASKAVFRKQFESDLASRYRLIALDLPGHGESADAVDPESGYTIPGYADVALEVLAALGARGAGVVGWSLGGHVGLELAGRPAAIAALLTCGAPPFAPGRAGLAAAFPPSPLGDLPGREALSEEELSRYAAVALGTATPEPVALEALRRADGRARRCMVAALRAGTGADQRRIAETAPLPLAVVNGADDPFIDHAYCEEVRYANLWRGRVHRIADTGHAPFWERPDTFNALLGEFLADIFDGA